MEDKISVIVPIYKVEKYLRKCVDSIVNQTYKNLEIILVDDGSPDNCPAMCDEYAKLDNRIKVIHKQNGGVSSARNVGLDCAKGSFVCFVDSDDTIELTMLEDLHQSIVETNSQLAVCCVRCVFENRIQENCPFDQDFVLDTRDKQEFNSIYSNPKIDMASVCNKMYRKNLLSNQRIKKDLIYAEDMVFNLEYYAKIDKIAFVSKCLYNYSIHADSCIQSNMSQLGLLGLKVLPYEIEFCNNTNNPELLKSFASGYLKVMVASLYPITKNEGKQNSKRIFKDIMQNEIVKHFVREMDTFGLKNKILKLALKLNNFTLCHMLSKLQYKKKVEK